MYSNNNLVLIDFINEITSEVMININKCYMKTVKSNVEGFSQLLNSLYVVALQVLPATTDMGTARCEIKEFY